MDLAAMVGSRICHDLVSPVGAIGNGVELMELSQNGHGAGQAELALISDSVSNARTRIKFFRIAFGHAAEDQRIAGRDVSALLKDMSELSRVNYRWDGPEDVARRELRALFLAMLCAETALPTGGAITVLQTEEIWQVIVEAVEFRAEGEIWQALSNGTVPDALAPATVQFALLPGAVTELGKQLNVKICKDAMTLSF